MISNGLYIIKQEYIDLVKKLGGNFDDKDASKRPIYCCVEDKYIKGYIGQYLQVIGIIEVIHNKKSI